MGFLLNIEVKKEINLHQQENLHQMVFGGDLFGVEDNYTKLKNEFYGKMGAINFD